MARRTLVARVRRFFVVVFLLALVAGLLYGASWFNHRRFFLKVGLTEAAVTRGRFLPYGDEIYTPRDPILRRAYRPFPLPQGLEIARATRIYTDLGALNQALYGLLLEAAEAAIQSPSPESSELLDTYVFRLETLPGASQKQRNRFERIEDASYQVKARHQVSQAEKALESAIELLGQRAKQDRTGSRLEALAARALAELRAEEGEPDPRVAPSSTARQARSDTESSTAGPGPARTSTGGAD